MERARSRWFGQRSKQSERAWAKMAALPRYQRQGAPLSRERSWKPHLRQQRQPELYWETTELSRTHRSWKRPPKQCLPAVSLRRLPPQALAQAVAVSTVHPLVLEAMPHLMHRHIHCGR